MYFGGSLGSRIESDYFFVAAPETLPGVSNSLARMDRGLSSACNTPVSLSQ